VSRVEVFPSAQHGELSTCDNHFNAIVKNQWRSFRSKNGNETYDSILLLSLCDKVKPATIRGMFVRNYMLDSNNITLSAVEDLLSQKTPKGAKCDRLFAGYKAAYRDWVAENDWEEPEEHPEQPPKGLDGAYWAE